MGSIKPRDYQTEMSDAIVNGFKTLKHPFAAVASTAAGKSVVIADVCHKLDEPVLILQPTKEILLQNYAKLQAYGYEDISMYSASVGQKIISRFTFATIGSIYKKPELFKHFKYCIIDECHQVAPKNISGMYMKFFRETGIEKICGLTATPFRLENKYVRNDDGSMCYTGVTQMLNRITRKPFFREFVYKIEMEDLIDRNFLLEPNYHTYDVDMSELIVNTTGRDYTDESLEKWGDKKLSNLVSIAETLEAKHKRVLVFCSSLRQCGRAVELLKSMGIHAEVLDGKTPKKQREDLITRFQDGSLKWVVNVGTMTTGFDCPPLDAIVLLRPTMSVALYVQMVGRGVRLDPDDPFKTSHIYDFSGSHEKFGPAQKIRLGKEDGFKDMLYGERGRIDNVALFSFDVKNDKFKKKEITLADIMAKI